MAFCSVGVPVESLAELVSRQLRSTVGSALLRATVHLGLQALLPLIQYQISSWSTVLKARNGAETASFGQSAPVADHQAFPHFERPSTVAELKQGIAWDSSTRDCQSFQ
jgi:hypothetical protein